jgi:hypothetical protein
VSFSGRTDRVVSVLFGRKRLRGKAILTLRDGIDAEIDKLGTKLKEDRLSYENREPFEQSN